MPFAAMWRWNNGLPIASPIEKRLMNRLPDPKTLFQDVDTTKPVIVAVSGGSDSVALLLLAAAWARHNEVELQVATVDHGLRPEAAAEAAFVASLSEALDVSHVTLAWDGIKPGSGVPEAARGARYRLLEEFAPDIGANTVLAGHTANDQAETLAMRLEREGDDSSGRGLSGMATVTLLPQGTRLVRPLLKLTRNELRSYLRDHNQSWIEDPSNSDEAYERVRVRRMLENNPEQVYRLCRFADVMARLRRVQAKEAARVLADNLKVDSGPVYTLTVDDLSRETPQVLTLALQNVIAIAGGGEHLVSAKSVRPVLEFLTTNKETKKESGDNKKIERTTLGNVVIERRSDVLRIYREARNLPAILLGPGDDAIWDGRLQIENGTASAIFCGPLDLEQIQEAEFKLGGKLPVSPRVALRSMPYLRGEDHDVLLPFMRGFVSPNGIRLRLCVRALEHYCPEFDFALLEWLVTFREHSGLTPVSDQKPR